MDKANSVRHNPLPVHIHRARRIAPYQHDREPRLPPELIHTLLERLIVRFCYTSAVDNQEFFPLDDELSELEAEALELLLEEDEPFESVELEPDFRP